MQHLDTKDLPDFHDLDRAVKRQQLKELFATHESQFMTPFISRMVTTVFDQALHKMIILRGVFRSRGCYPQERTITFRSLKDRCESRSEEDTVPLEDVNYYKLQREINQLMVIWKEATLEIREFGTYLNAQDMYEVLKRMNDDTEELIKQEPINRKRMLDLRSKLAKDRDYYNREIKNTIEEINVLQFTLEDVKTYSLYELKYLMDYEDARVEQNNLLHDGQEKDLTDFISDMNVKISQENTVHQLMTSYIDESKNDYQEKIEYWSKYYDQETENRNQELTNLKNNIEKIQEELVALNQHYNGNQKLIDEWMEYARQRDENEQQEEREQYASQVLQVWWIYVMKKNKLGLYGVVKGKKKGKGKK